MLYVDSVYRAFGKATRKISGAAYFVCITLIMLYHNLVASE